MRKTTKSLGAALALVMILTALPALAAEGRIPVWQPYTAIGPGQEGQYILTRNIFTQGGQPAIDILPGTGAVEIDLNGFSIYGVDVNVIQALNSDSVVLRNGTIFGPDAGSAIFAQELRKVIIEDLKIEWQVDGNSATAIKLIEVQNFAIRRNVIVGAGSEGIYLDGSLGEPKTFIEGSVESNLIRGCGRGILLHDGSSVGMINNRIEKTTSSEGIWISPGPDGFVGCLACLLKENTIQETATDGMGLYHFEVSKLFNNVITFSGGNGIYLDGPSQDNLILDNVSGQNAQHGMQIDSPQNHIERSVLNTNGFPTGVGFGLLLNAPANTYRGNTAQGNPGPPAACPGAPATPDFCDATGGANNSIGDNFMPGLL